MKGEESCERASESERKNGKGKKKARVETGGRALQQGFYPNFPPGCCHVPDILRIVLSTSNQTLLSKQRDELNIFYCFALLGVE